MVVATQSVIKMVAPITPFISVDYTNIHYWIFAVVLVEEARP